jgi:uncharacterized protein YlxP (DUF503 family)
LGFYEMFASCFEVTFTIPGASNLKEKRMVVKSIKERCKNRFNVSVAESSHSDKWQICTLGFALAAISASAANQNMLSIIDFLYDDNRVDITNIEKY